MNKVNKIYNINKVKTLHLSLRKVRISHFNLKKFRGVMESTDADKLKIKFNRTDIYNKFWLFVWLMVLKIEFTVLVVWDMKNDASLICVHKEFLYNLREVLGQHGITEDEENRTWVRSIFVSHRRNHHKMHMNQALLKLDGVMTREEAEW